MLQNRITPYGEIIKTSARGAWMGNRGILHDEEKNILRPYKLKAWLTCLLQFNGRQRTVMTPNRYTELFFFDEATAFAAGHRPCFECRRQDFVRFKASWLKGNPGYGFDGRVPIQQIDAILHRERINHDGSKVKYEGRIGALPDGTFIEYEGNPYLIADGFTHRWSPSGYAERERLPHTKLVTVLTPRSVVNAFIAGYKPQMGLMAG